FLIDEYLTSSICPIGEQVGGDGSMAYHKVRKKVLPKRLSPRPWRAKTGQLDDVHGPARKSSTNDPTADLLKQVAELQISIGEKDAAWIGRVNADLGTTLRIAVVGERSAKTAALINTLLENPLQNSLQSSESHVRKISYGVVHAKVAGSGDVKSSAEWLLKNEVQIYEVPGFDIITPAQLEEVVYKSDLIIVVTSASNRLTSPRESAFMKKFYTHGKASLIIAVDGLEQHTEDTIEVLEGVRERLQSFTPRNTGVKLPHVAVVPVNVRRALAAQALLQKKEPPARFAEEWSASGLQDLKASIIARVDTPVDRAAHKLLTATFTASQALQRLADGQSTTEIALESAKFELQGLIDRVVKAEKRLVRDFEETDLAVVQDSVSALSEAVRKYFAKVRFWKLFWRSDFVADDLKAMMRQHNLLQAEYQMVYAVGKLNEGLYGLRERLQEHMASLTNPNHPISAVGGSAAKALREDLVRIRDILDEQTLPNAPVSHADPFILRNQVMRFDASRHCDDLQRKAEKLVRRQAGFQILLYGSAVIGTHLGVPFAIMLPSALTISAAGFGWMRLRWGALESRFWGKVSEGHKTLKDNILGIYQKEFTSVVAEPLVSIIRLVEEAIATRRREVAANRQAIAAALKQVEEVDGTPVDRT
ncbi:hypothetical protein HKX48_008500, partial [Thoreauomyces humboldtii]